MEGADAMTCGINTNMCAALLHVISDLARSTTTLVESVIILNLNNVNTVHVDGYSTLIVCGIIVVGATSALLTWMREVYLFLVTPVGMSLQDEAERDLMRDSSKGLSLRPEDEITNRTSRTSRSSR